MEIKGGSLQKKKGFFYAVLNVYDDYGKRKLKWIPTDIEVKGGKRDADKRLREILVDYEKNQPDLYSEFENISFVDFMKRWLENMKNSIEPNTLESYNYVYERHIEPYFRPKMIILKKLTPYHIETYYKYLMEKGRLDGKGGLSANSVKHQHANISKCLDYAVKQNIILFNPAQRVQLPKIEKKNNATVYKLAQIQSLLDAFKNDPLEPVIILTVFYGLRRSEVLGLKWSAVDFDNMTITVNHKVIKMQKGVYLAKNGGKNNTSLRTFPLIDEVEIYLKDLKKKQDAMIELQPNDYNKSEYICVDYKGQLLRPDYVSQHFALVLEKNNLQHMRFHDLRHHSATYLHRMGFSFKEIQDWLGHSSIVTTMDFYTSTDIEDKKKIAKKLNDTYKIPGRKSKQA